MKKLILPHITIPFEDEFLGGYLIRASFINGYQSPKQMLNSAGISIHNSSLESIFTDETKFLKVIEQLNFSMNLLKLVIKKVPPTSQAFFWGNNQKIPVPLVDIDLNKFCPACLKSTAYWKKLWLLKPNMICDKHGIYLLSDCPQCKSNLSINRKSLFKCSKCKFDLRTSSQQIATKDEIDINNWFLKSLLIDDENFAEDFLYIWNALIEYFLNLNIKVKDFYILKLSHNYFYDRDLFINKMVTQIRNNLDYAHPRIQALPFLRNKVKFQYVSDKILSQFYNYNFYSTKLIHREISKIDATYILKISFASFDKRLKTGILYHNELVKNGKAYFTTSVLEDWLINEGINITAPYTYNKPPAIVDEAEAYFDICQISQILNINPDTVRKFMRIPEVNKTKKSINGHLKLCLSRDFINNFDKKYIFVSSLAKHIGVSATHLKDKISSLNIEPVNQNNLCPAYYLRDDVKNLDKSIIDDIKSYKNNRGRKKKGFQTIVMSEVCVGLNEAAKLLDISSHQMAQLIQYNWINVEDIEERPYRIPKKSINDFLQKKNDPSFIDINEVLKIINFTFSQLQKTWIMTGFLTVRHLGYWKFVPKKQFEFVLEIHKEYFTAFEANNFLGMHRTHITNLITQGLIKPHLFGNHNYSIRLFKKKDVGKLLEAGYGKKK